MVLKELGLAAAVASGLLASAQAQGGLGLALYVPHDINTTSVTTTTWYGDFKAPLTTTFKGKADWAAFCVDVGESCYVEPVSEIATGDYTVMKEVIDFEVTLDPTISNYTCYVATVLSKGMVCSDPIPVTKGTNGNGREFDGSASAPPKVVAPKKSAAAAPKKPAVVAAPAPEVEVVKPPKVVAPKKPAAVAPKKPAAAAPKKPAAAAPKKPAAAAPKKPAAAAPKKSAAAAPKKPAAAAPKKPAAAAPKKPAVVIAAPAPEVEVVKPPKVVAPKKPATENKATIADQVLSDDQVLDDDAILL